MYSSTHSSAAIAVLLLPLPLPVTIPLAILSHAAVDTIGEGSLTKWVQKETPLHLALLAFGALTGHLFIVILGIILGNAFDILDMRKVDKTWFKAVVVHKPNRFGKWFYPPVLWQLTPQQTFDFNVVATVVTCGLLFL